MDINVTALRLQGRPLWMSNFAMDSFADILGGGGDIYLDRLPPEWERHLGEELLDEDLELVNKSLGEIETYGADADSPAATAETAPPSLAEEAFKYVHSE